MTYSNFFWLHIKKSGGITIRKYLDPHYVEVDRSKKPSSFLQADPVEYNDILNNFRVPLGEYQFRRALFAKKFLYPGTWDQLYSFAILRDPVDRCLSMFSSLYWQDNNLRKRIISAVNMSWRSKKIHTTTKYAFDLFLDAIQTAHSGRSNYAPLGIKFSTHTAPVWDDITDENGQILLTRTFRLDDLASAINQVFTACGINKQIEQDTLRLNRNIYRSHYSPSKAQLGRIQELYAKDFKLYEDAV